MAKFQVICKLETTVVIEADTPEQAITIWEQKQEYGELSLDHFITSYDDPYTVRIVDTWPAHF